MSDHQPQTVSELMSEAASALEARNFDRLEDLVRVADQWVQPASDTQAQLHMLEAMMCACEELRHDA